VARDALVVRTVVEDLPRPDTVAAFLGAFSI
jgi:hypothetical protein